MSTKIDEVKSLFESPQPYLERRRYNINIRAETVQYFLRNREFTRILDIGCGDGSVSIPLLNPQPELTLLDLSANMLSAAQSNIPSNLSNTSARSIRISWAQISSPIPSTWSFA
jgi:predicted TPR repeat methyltransferase